MEISVTQEVDGKYHHIGFIRCSVMCSPNKEVIQHFSKPASVKKVLSHARAMKSNPELITLRVLIDCQTYELFRI